LGRKKRSLNYHHSDYISLVKKTKEETKKREHKLFTSKVYSWLKLRETTEKNRRKYKR